MNIQCVIMQKRTLSLALDNKKKKLTQKLKFALEIQEKLWEKEKMLVTNISPFPTMLSKVVFNRVIKSQDRVVQG